MKKFHLWLTCLFLCASLTPAFAQKSKAKYTSLEAQVGVPNGIWIDTLKINIDQTEICNLHWIEYCKWLKENEPEKLAAALPDTTVWANIAKEGSSKTLSFQSNYYEYDGFRFFPVVGISKAQAEEFCKWRSKVVNENYARQTAKKRKGIYKDYDVEIIYRLPTQKEWETIAQAQNNDPHGFTPRTRKQRRAYPENYPRANCKKERVQSGEVDRDGSLLTEYLFAYGSNGYGTYNLIGNVAEMVQEEGIAKGGSWIHSLDESTIKAQQTYTSPTAWLGFRCVSEIKLTPRKATL